MSYPQAAAVTADEYHGIVLDISQKDRSIFKSLRLIGKKKVLLGLAAFHKIAVEPDRIQEVIHSIQGNMSNHVGPFRQEFYFHFYNKDRLLIVYRDRVFDVTPDPDRWKEAVQYGRSLNIAAKQLDFSPCRFEDETY